MPSARRFVFELMPLSRTRTASLPLVKLVCRFFPVGKRLWDNADPPVRHDLDASDFKARLARSLDGARDFSLAKFQWCRRHTVPFKSFLGASGPHARPEPRNDANTDFVEAAGTAVI